MNLGDAILAKYKPSSLDAFVGNKSCISDMKTALQNLPNTPILLLGHIGSGKTTLVELICKDLDISIIKLSFEGTSCHKDNVDVIENALYKKHISSFFCNKTKCIFIDDLEILIHNDRFFNTYLQTLLKSKLPSIHVLFTASTSDERKLSDIKKRMNVIRLENPIFDDAYTYVKRIIVAERYNTILLDQYIKECVLVHNCNIRSTLLNVFSNLSQKQEKFYKQFFDMGIYNIIHKVMDREYERNSIIPEVDLLVSYEPLLISLLLYDNVYDYSKLCLGSSLDLKCISSIVANYFESNIMEYQAYNNNDMFLQNLSYLIKTSTIVNSLQSLKNMTKPRKSTCIPEYKFTQILTKTALRHNMEKKMVRSCSNGLLQLSNMYFIANLGLNTCTTFIENNMSIEPDQKQLIDTYRSLFVTKTTKNKKNNNTNKKS